MTGLAFGWILMEHAHKCTLMEEAYKICIPMCLFKNFTAYPYSFPHLTKFFFQRPKKWNMFRIKFLCH